MGEGEIDSNAGGILETERGGIKEKLVCCRVWTGKGFLRGRGGDGRKGRECTHTEGSPGAKLEGSGLRNRRSAMRRGAGVETGGGLGAQNVAGLGPANSGGGMHLRGPTSSLLWACSWWQRVAPTG